MESAIFRLKSSLEGVNQNNPLIFLPRIKSLRMFVIFPRKCLPLQSAFSIRLWKDALWSMGGAHRNVELSKPKNHWNERPIHISTDTWRDAGCYSSF